MPFLSTLLFISKQWKTKFLGAHPIEMYCAYFWPQACRLESHWCTCWCILYAKNSLDCCI